jgi:hypothetical protein
MTRQPYALGRQRERTSSRWLYQPCTMTPRSTAYSQLLL